MECNNSRRMCMLITRDKVCRGAIPIVVLLVYIATKDSLAGHASELTPTRRLLSSPEALGWGFTSFWARLQQPFTANQLAQLPICTLCQGRQVSLTNSSCCVDMLSSSLLSNGRHLTTALCTASAVRQRWKYASAGVSGILINCLTGLCMDAHHAATASAAAGRTSVMQAACQRSSVSQRWWLQHGQFHPQGSTELCLTADAGGLAVAKCTGSSQQQWKLQAPAGPGTPGSVGSGMACPVPSASAVPPGWASTLCPGCSASAVLAKHNEYRTRHSVPAMVWDSSLADVAFAWAQKCRFEHSTESTYGENLAVNSAALTATMMTNAVVNWYQEVSQYNFTATDALPNNFPKVGHFTQVVWRNTAAVGCAAVTCRSLRFSSGSPWAKATNMVCNYSPPGNYRGSFPANVFPAN